MTKKLCSRKENCLDPKGPDLPIACFSKRVASKDGLSYTCKTCERDTAKKSWQRQKKKKRERKYYETNKETVRDRSRKRYEENREMILDQSSEYRRANPDVYRQADARRRERLKNAEREPYIRADIIDRDSVDGVPICQICGEPILKASDIQIDHIIPVCKEGSDTPLNVRVACGTCNRRRPKDGSDVIDKLN